MRSKSWTRPAMAGENRCCDRPMSGAAAGTKPWLRIRVLLLCLLGVFWTSTGAAGGVISLPKTGQTTCYTELGGVIACTGTGQDGDVRSGVDWPSPRFTFSGECFTDQLTGLTWITNAQALPSLLWSDGIAYANALSRCGFTDWRVANANEISSISNSSVQCTSTWLQGLGITFPAINGFSSTTQASATTNAWVTQFCEVPRTTTAKTTTLIQVMPVRGGQANAADPAFPANLPKTGQTTSYASGDDGDLEWGVAWPSPRFTNRGDGTITDNLTGLDWTENASSPGPAACSPGVTKHWQASLDHVQCLNSNGYLGHSDWRMPNKFELRSLVDLRNSNPALPTGHPFASFSPATYWTSTTIVSSTNRGAWAVNFFDGVQSNIGIGKSTSNLWLWPVRTSDASPALTVLGPFSVADVFQTPPCWTGGGCTPANFPYDWGVLRTFTYTLPPGQHIAEARINGTWGSSSLSSTAPVDVYLEGRRVARCLVGQPCWSQLTTSAWNGNSGFLLSHVGVSFADPAVRALFEDGTATLSVVQNDVVSASISNMRLTLYLPEPEASSMGWAGLLGLVGLGRLRSKRAASPLVD